MAAHRLTERVAAPFAGSTVDRDAGVIRGVLVCGTDSANGRRYDWAGRLKGRISLYEGRPVNCDHGSDATVDRRLGWLVNPRAGTDGRPRADLHILRSHPLADRVFEAAERNPALFGLSHVAMCSTRRGSDGVEVVEGIERVESVDLVADPATTKGLYEHRHQGGRTVPKLSEWVTGFARHPKATTKQIIAVKALAEMDGMGELPMPADAPAPDAPDGDADDAVMAAFKAAIGAVVDQAMSGGMDPKTALQKIKTLLKSHGELNSDGTPDTDGDPETGAGDEPPAEEARSTAADLTREALEVCRKVGWKGFDADDLDVIGAAPAALRESLARRLMGSAAPPAGAEPPRSGGKKPGGELPAKTKTAGSTGGSVPTTAKEFAESVRR